MIVQYYADSLGLSRPGAVTLEQRYIYIFEEWLRQNTNENVFVINRSRRGFTIDKLYEVFKEDEEYIDGQKNILIIHEGVCDCAPRPISARVRKFVGILPGFIKKRVIHYLHNNRAKLMQRGSVHYLVAGPEYEKILFEWLEKAVKTFSRVYLFTIAPTNDRIEKHSPGFGKSIEDYNAIIKTVVQKINNDCIKIIDVHAAIKQSGNIDDYIIAEDGHHITAKAHKMYANYLISLESQGVH